MVTKGTSSKKKKKKEKKKYKKFKRNTEVNESLVDSRYLFIYPFIYLTSFLLITHTKRIWKRGEQEWLTVITV